MEVGHNSILWLEDRRSQQFIGLERVVLRQSHVAPRKTQARVVEVTLPLFSERGAEEKRTLPHLWGEAKEDDRKLSIDLAGWVISPPGKAEGAGHVSSH